MSGDALVHYRPARGGGWWVAVEGAALALLAPDVTERTADAVWRRVGDGGIGAVLDALTGAFGTSLAAIPPFALAVAEPTGLRVAVRGPIEVIIDTPEGTQAVTGESVATWAERFVPAATRVTIAPEGGAAEDAAVPVRSGVVVADLVVATLGVGVGVGAGAGAGAGAGVGVGAGVPAAAGAGVGVGAPAAASAVVPAAPPASAASASAASAPEPPASVVTSSEIDSSSDANAAQVSEKVQISEEAHAQDAAGVGGTTATTTAAGDSADTWLPETEAPPVDEYDLLWGETVARPVAAAAIATATAEDEGEDAGHPAPAARSTTSEISTSSDANPAAGSEEVQISEELPTDAGAASPTPAPTPAALGDHDGATVSVAEARALRAAEREHYESTDNVPGRRPARGRIVLSSGRVVELERPVVIGRRPKSTRTSGSELPTLVAVDSPEQDISRNHVEIRAEGEHVLVTDLHTTNGTILLRGGADPVRLHPGEPTMVVDGDVLDLGDGVTVTFEDLA